MSRIETFSIPPKAEWYILMYGNFNSLVRSCMNTSTVLMSNIWISGLLTMDVSMVVMLFKVLGGDHDSSIRLLCMIFLSSVSSSWDRILSVSTLYRMD